MIQQKSIQNRTVQLRANARKVHTATETCQTESDKILTLLHEVRAQPSDRSRNALYAALKKRLEAVTTRIASAYRMGSADIEDIVQEALRKFAEQEKNGSGIFSSAPSANGCPRKLNADIKGSVQQRSATWYRAQKKQARIVACSLDDVPCDIEDAVYQNRLESDAAAAEMADRELRKQISETVSVFLATQRTPLTHDAIEAAMTDGSFNTAQLSRRHKRSQPTVWREVREVKRRLRSALERDGFGGV